jgi:hypothetical protein
VENVLKGSLKPALDGLAKWLGIGSIPAAIAKILKDIKTAAQKPIVVVLTALGKLIKQAFDALLGRFGLGTVTPKPLLDPLTFSPSKVYVGEDNVVRIKGAGLTAQPKELAPVLQQAKSKAGPMQQMAYTTAETKRSELTGLTTQLTAELRKPKPQAMRVVDLRKQAQDKEQELSTALHGLCGLASCFGAGTPLWGVRGQLPIEAAQIGDAVWTHADRETGCPTPRERSQWRVAVFAVERSDGSRVDVALLRDLAWLAAQGVREGAKLWLSLPEMGVNDRAQVLALRACPELDESRGGLVTGTFWHTGGVVYDLQVEGEEKPLRVTGTHPFWSVDREEWVAVEELRTGERLQGKDGGTLRVLGRTERAEREPVWNIEVEADHTYRVGEQGLLVHNQSYHQILNTPGEEHYERYARESATYRGRQPQGSELLAGKQNLGAVRYYLQSAGRTITNRSASGHFISMGGGLHSEVRILAWLQATYGFCTPNANPCETPLYVTEIYTERYPCPSCRGNGGPILSIAACNFDASESPPRKVEFAVYWVGTAASGDQDYAAPSSGALLIQAYRGLDLYPWP